MHYCFDDSYYVGFIMSVCIILTTVSTTDRQHAARTSEKEKLVNLGELWIFILAISKTLV